MSTPHKYIYVVTNLTPQLLYIAASNDYSRKSIMIFLDDDDEHLSQAAPVAYQNSHTDLESIKNVLIVSPHDLYLIYNMSPALNIVANAVKYKFHVEILIELNNAISSGPKILSN